MESFQFQRSKKRQANEDNDGGEQKNYCLLLNSSDRVAGSNHNTAEFNIPFEFLPHNYEYYRMDYSFQTTAGVYKDSFSDFGAQIVTPGNLISTSVFDTAQTTFSIAPNAKVTSTDPLLTFPSNLLVTSYRSGTGGVGVYQLNQTLPLLSTTSFTGTMASGANSITGVVGTPVIGRYVFVSSSLATGAKVLYQDPVTPTTWYVSKSATGTITAGSFTQYVSFTTRVNNSTATLNMNFGCKKMLYDTSNRSQSSFMGNIQRITNTLVGTNQYKSWWQETPSQIINMGNFNGTITTRITNGDDPTTLLVDTNFLGQPLSDMTPWQMMVSFTPIPSSSIETQCY
jgi:hypothetical protein